MRNRFIFVIIFDVGANRIGFSTADRLSLVLIAHNYTVFPINPIKVFLRGSCGGTENIRTIKSPIGPPSGFFFFLYFHA